MWGGEVKGEEMAPGLQADSPGGKAKETKGCSGREAITGTGSPALASSNKHTKPNTLVHTFIQSAPVWVAVIGMSF